MRRDPLIIDLANCLHGAGGADADLRRLIGTTDEQYRSEYPPARATHSELSYHAGDVRAGVLLIIAMGCSKGTPVPCNGVLEPGELCDDGNSSDGDGCDCATRMISPVSYTPKTGDPVVLVEDGGWCWFQDERVLDVDGK